MVRMTTQIAVRLPGMSSSSSLIGPSLPGRRQVVRLWSPLRSNERCADGWLEDVRTLGRRGTEDDLDDLVSWTGANIEVGD